MEDCIFCKIVRGDIPGTKVYEDEDFVAFLDVQPQAKTHILVIPRIHMKDALACYEHSPDLLANGFLTAVKVARLQGLDGSGFRIATNTGADGRQSVPHLHFHVLGGQPLSERVG